MSDQTLSYASREPRGWVGVIAGSLLLAWWAVDGLGGLVVLGNFGALLKDPDDLPVPTAVMILLGMFGAILLLWGMYVLYLAGCVLCRRGGALAMAARACRWAEAIVGLCLLLMIVSVGTEAMVSPPSASVLLMDSIIVGMSTAVMWGAVVGTRMYLAKVAGAEMVKSGNEM